MTTASKTARRPRIDSEADPNYRVEVHNLDTRVLVRITRMAFAYRWRMGLGIAATVGAAVFQLFVPQFLGRAVDQAHGLLAAASEAAGRTSAEEALFVTALLLIGASIMRGICTMLQNYQGEAVGQILGYDLRMAYYRKLQQLSFAWHDRVHTGDLMTRGILDIEGVRLWTDTGILRMVLLTVLIGGGAVILIRIDLVLGLLALSFVPVVGVSASIARLKLRDSWLRLQDELSTLTKVMEENLNGIRVVRAFAAHAFEMKRLPSRTSASRFSCATPRA
jgi:ATP-binding cassette subfamily B multidrug efflux pump